MPKEKTLHIRSLKGKAYVINNQYRYLEKGFNNRGKAIQKIMDTSKYDETYTIIAHPGSEEEVIQFTASLRMKIEKTNRTSHTNLRLKNDPIPKNAHELEMASYQQQQKILEKARKAIPTLNVFPRFEWAGVVEPFTLPLNGKEILKVFKQIEKKEDRLFSIGIFFLFLGFLSLLLGLVVTSLNTIGTAMISISVGLLLIGVAFCGRSLVISLSKASKIRTDLNRLSEDFLESPLAQSTPIQVKRLFKRGE